MEQLVKIHDQLFLESCSPDLPVLRDKETASGFSRSELEERISYAKERMNYYKNAFEDSEIPAERDHFQKCCEWYVNRIVISEIALERITAEKI